MEKLLFYMLASPVPTSVILGWVGTNKLANEDMLYNCDVSMSIMNFYIIYDASYDRDYASQIIMTSWQDDSLDWF